ncbi:hypothetical protein PSPO_a2036 [Pseudoalteromonas spongiae UST010723-006]|nr:hypothetical protein PSPO_a2036 [Pseudoalteromonas spongiae UST010723-006]
MEHINRKNNAKKRFSSSSEFQLRKPLYYLSQTAGDMFWHIP